jgi:hypothetical protein
MLSFSRLMSSRLVSPFLSFAHHLSTQADDAGPIRIRD